MAQLICNRAYKPLKNETDPFRALSKAVSGDSLDKMILVVPTGKLVRRLLNTVVREYFGRYKKPVSKPAIYTLKGFVQSIFSRIPESREYRLISDAYRLALVEEAAAKADLKFFARNNKNVSPSILDRLANIIYGLKEDGISYDDLYEDLDDENTDYDKLNDIANLYRAYEDILGEKYLDFPGLLNKTIEYFGESDLTDSSELFPEKNEIDKFFDKGAEILFYGFSEFKKPEEMFISLFSDSRIPLGINIDYDTSNGPLFSNLESVIINLKDNGFDLYDSRDLKGKSGEFHIVTNLAAVKEAGLKEDPLSLPPVTYIRRWLFNNEKEIRYPELSGQISIVEAPSRTEEARFVVKLAGKLITDDGYKPSDICIVCRHLDMYSGLYRELFEEYGVPMNVTDRFPLTGSPVAAAIFSILDIINNGYKRKDIHKALKSRYLSFSKDNPADTENLIDSAMRLRIEGGHRRGGRKFWETRLSGRIKFLKEKLYDLKKDDNNDPLEISNIKESLAKAQKALYDFTGMADSLPDVENLMNPADFVRIIKDKIIAAYDIRGNIIANFEKIKKIKQNLNAIEYIRLMEKVEQDSAAFTAFLEILDEMEFILTDRTPEKKFRPAELTEILKTAMSGGKYQVKEKRNLGITVTTIEQIRGLDFKVSILCGAVDAEFPLAYRPETFLGKELPDTKDRHIQSERMQFYRFLTNSSDTLEAGSKKIFITYPKYQETRQLVRSPFVDSLLKITTLQNDGRLFLLNDLLSVKDKNDELPEILINQAKEFSFIFEPASLNEVITDLSEKIENIKPGQGIFEKFPRLADAAEYLRDYLSSSDDGNMFRDILESREFTDAASEYLDKYRDKNYSVTELETYASCPYKYFVQRMLKVKAPEKVDMSLSPVETGSLLHNVLYKFYRTLQDKSAPDPLTPVMLDPSDHEKYRKLLKEIAVKEMEDVKFEHPFFELEEREILGVGDEPGKLDFWLDSEMERIENGWGTEPVLFELGFGSSKKYSADDKEARPEVNLPGGLSLTGKIDRLELSLTGDEPIYLVTDYKRSIGSQPGLSKIEKGLAFQVPLYLAAAKIILKDHFGTDAEPAGGVYYSLNPSYDPDKNTYEGISPVIIINDGPFPYEMIKGKPKTPEEIEKIINNSIKKATGIKEKIIDGSFPVDPADDNACRYCELYSVCRVLE